MLVLQENQSTSQTRRPERSFTVCSRNFAPTSTVRACASLHVKQNTDISEVARDVKYHGWEKVDDLLLAKSKGKRAANGIAHGIPL